MQIETNNASYDMELKNQDFETQVEIHDEISKFEEGVEKSA
jgi:protein-arginine kinase activator protein McsA